MKGWLLDTNIVVELRKARRHPSVDHWARAQSPDLLFISSLVIGEHRQGIEGLDETDPRRVEYRRILDATEAAFHGRILPVSDPIVETWGELRGRGRRLDAAHQTPPVIDTFMVATAIVHRLHLVTRNTRDVAWSGWSVFNPWADNWRDYSITA